MISIVLTSTVASGCMRVAHNKPNLSGTQRHGDNLYHNMINQGTLCIQKMPPKKVAVSYYPLSSSCVSSSLYSWKLNGFDANIHGNSMNIESYSLFTKNNSTIATADCAGAHIVRKTLQVPQGTTTLSWGKKQLTTLDSSKRVCFQSANGEYKKVKSLP